MVASGSRLIERFDRRPDGGGPRIARIGSGDIGGKAAGLVFLRDEVVRRIDPSRHPGIEIEIPRLTVLGTDVFEAFLALNDLRPGELEGRSDVWVAHRFQRTHLPATVVGDLHAFVRQIRIPVAVRSSSRLEDALDHPFAGVYATKMLPNNQHDPATRFRRLLQAIKFVYGSAWSRAARDYHASLPSGTDPESMAVVLQDVVGCRHRDRFYPDFSGVIRSWSAYPLPGCRPEDGVVDLAIGLGRQIVEGGRSWSYCPRRPEATAPFASLADRARLTQSTFWGIHMGPPPAPDPTRETEYLREFELARAEEDGRLDLSVSTWDPAGDRLRPGLAGARGMPRIADFGPLTRYPSLPFNEALVELTDVAAEQSGSPVEIEFAARLPERTGAPLRVSVLQVRPIAVGGGDTEVEPASLEDERMVIRSSQVVGDGACRLSDVVFVEPEGFDRAHTREVATEIASLNAQLVSEQRPYVLIGFGRWGSSDPWLGIPVQWGQISGVRVLVEAALDELSADPSQGSHFFHNMVGRRVMLLNVSRRDTRAISWEYLRGLEEIRRTRWCRHVRASEPLRVLVDGRRGLGVVLRNGG